MFHRLFQHLGGRSISNMLSTFRRRPPTRCGFSGFTSNMLTQHLGQHTNVAEMESDSVPAKDTSMTTPPIRHSLDTER